MERKTILVMGGSQGAHGINQAVLSALPNLVGRPVQSIHLSGPNDQDELRQAYDDAGIPAWVAPFHHRMEAAYSVADIAIARSGAASLTELSHFGLPSILIPYPHAAEDHQTLNARIFEKAGAATLVAETEAAEQTLSKVLMGLLDDETRLSEMSGRAANLAQRDAAERVAETILKFCQSPD
jgi:UDP-N-acetylglucosamine--N-acetylmuramyl-(pentapeptide) pyrophosphoryl-undecaprenol N-acetylglucosamine transferase